MENASKALIIAGAILLSILIIGLGMFIFTQASDVLQGTSMDATRVQAYNADFVSYEGAQTGISVKSLINTVASHNRANESDASLQIGVVIPGNTTCQKTLDTLGNAISADSVGNLRTSILSSQRYVVSFDYGKSGEIININIAVQGATTGD